MTKTAEMIIEEDIKKVYLGNLNTVEFDLNLPEKGENGSRITWESDNELFLRPDGCRTGFADSFFIYQHPSEYSPKGADILDYFAVCCHHHIWMLQDVVLIIQYRVLTSDKQKGVVVGIKSTLKYAAYHTIANRI